MQNQNQDKPNYDQYSHDIDLVDLAVVIYRKKRTFLLAVLFSVVLATGYWFSLGEKIQVSAVFKTGQEAVLDSSGITISPLMSVSDSSDLLKLVYLPSLLKSNKAETGSEINKKIIDINYADSIEGSTENISVIELFAEGSQKDAQALVAIFNGSLEQLLKTHAEKLDKYRSSVSSLIESQKSEMLLLKELSTPENPNEGVALMPLVAGSIVSLNSLLAASAKSAIIKRASVESMGSKGLAMYVVVGLVAGLFLGCLLVFLLELYARAKIRAAETA